MTGVVYSNFWNTVLDIQPGRAGMITINLTIQLKSQEQEEEEFYSSDLLLSSEKKSGRQHATQNPLSSLVKEGCPSFRSFGSKMKDSIALISQRSKPWYWFCLELCKRNLEATSSPRLLSKTNADCHPTEGEERRPMFSREQRNTASPSCCLRKPAVGKCPEQTLWSVPGPELSRPRSESMLQLTDYQFRLGE